MSQEFKVEIISPDKTIYSVKSNEIILPCYERQVTVQKDHIPLITFLRPGLILIKNQDENKFYAEEGVVEFSNNNLLILTSTAKDLKNFDKSLINNLLELDHNINYCNIEIRPKGIILRFRSLLETYALIIPYYKLKLFKGKSNEYSVYIDKYFVKVHVGKKSEHNFFKKISSLRTSN